MEKSFFFSVFHLEPRGLFGDVEERSSVEREWR